ncbi:MAG TPA: class I SAM-dependent methyltransferase [Thermoplasmata archaeon]|nr:class I SAM-dependent methyltransferase [Thermoplasmata archaeon]
MDRDIRAFYRISEDFTRYLATSKERMEELRSLWRSNRRFFGTRVLDLACGGGVLGFLLEPAGHGYVGIEVNPDMIQGARAYAREVGSRNRFLLADITRKRVRGQFDTVTTLGNALCHFTPADFTRVLTNVQGATHRRSYFLLEYRDVVALLARQEWWTRKTIRRGKNKVHVVTKAYDTEHGAIEQDHTNVGSGRRVRFRHAIWSPFILEPLMASYDWTLVKRRRGRRDVVLDVYEHR